MAEREAQHEFHARQAIEDLVKAGLVPEVAAFGVGLAELFGQPLHQLRPGDRRSLGHPAADDRARAGLGGVVNGRLVLAFERGVGDLEGVEDPHGDVVSQVRQGPGHADETDLALSPQLDQFGDGVFLLKLGAARADVKLHQVDVVGLHTPEALLDPGADIGAGEDVRGPFASAAD